MAFQNTDWDNVMDRNCANSTVERLTQYILSVSKQHIPFGVVEFNKGAHAWLNKKCRAAIEDKCKAAGTPAFLAKASKCSEVLAKAFDEYKSRTKIKLQKGKMISKSWWKLSRELLFMKKAATSIPPQKDGSAWVTTAKGKADLFATTFAAKNVLAPEIRTPQWDKLEDNPNTFNSFIAFRTRKAENYWEIWMRIHQRDPTGCQEKF